MEKHYYNLDKSLGKYQALRTNIIRNDGFSGEIIDNGMDEYKNGSFEANIYTNGRLVDIELNGWTFSFHFKGDYHKPGYYKHCDFSIFAVDPNGNEVTLYNTPYYSPFSESGMLCMYLDLIHTYSNFKNGDIATKFYQLLRSLEGEGSSYRTVDKGIMEEVNLEHAKYFKNYYNENIKSCDNAVFMKQIKDAVNQAVDIVQNKFQSYKIQN